MQTATYSPRKTRDDFRANGNGGIAQLVEHQLCKLGVSGSSPLASTSYGI